MSGITLSWARPTKKQRKKIVGYRICRATYDSGPNDWVTVAKSLKPSKSTFVDKSPLTVGETYFYVIQALGKKHVSVWSEKVKVVFNPTKGKILPPKDVRVFVE